MNLNKHLMNYENVNTATGITSELYYKSFIFYISCGAEIRIFDATLLLYI